MMSSLSGEDIILMIDLAFNQYLFELKTLGEVINPRDIPCYRSMFIAGYAAGVTKSREVQRGGII